MAFDLQIDLSTGELVFDAKRDFAGVQAESLIKQRIYNRLKIERGTFIYDRTGTLGSRLASILGSGIPRNESSLRMLIQEALDPMTDINITDIEVFTYGDGSDMVTDMRKIAAKISYQIVLTNALSDLSIEPGQNSTLVTLVA